MKQPSKTNFISQIINSKYQVTKKIKTGGFGAVYTAKDISKSYLQYAVKLMPLQTKKYANVQLHMYELIQKVKFTNGFIKYWEHGEFMNHFYLLMELIGEDLEDIKKSMNHQRFSFKTVLMIGLQCIDRLEALHKIGYTHRDVKPDNLAIGLKEKSKIIYLFDFGLALKIGSEIPKDEKGKVVGTLSYMSCRGHQGKQQGPSDDIESLMYTLIYLLEGSLPWQKLQIKSAADFHKILLSKRGLANKSSGIKSNARIFLQILTSMHKHKWNDKVDYLQIKYKLLEGIKSIQQENDFMFDWLSPTERKKEELSPLRKKKAQSPDEQLKKRKKLEYMNEQNQQLVQNQIYQVFKFIEKGQEKKEVKKRSMSKSPQRNKVQPKEVYIPKEQKKKVRPMSAAIKPKKQVVKIPQWQKIIEFQTANLVSGPKIVINKTAKHKI